MICGLILAASLLVADLPDEAAEGLRSLPEGAPASEILARVREADGAYTYDFGSFSAETDRRWWGMASDGAKGSALGEFRRWPGDTVLAVYAVAEGPAPPVARAAWSAAPAPAGERRFEGTLETDDGPRAVMWCERAIAGAAARFAALVVPADGGLGAEGLAASRASLLDLWDRLEVRPEPWSAVPGVPTSEKVVPPETGLAPREGDERVDPWQTVAATGFTLGLPPGLRAVKTDTDIEVLRPVEGGLLWIRGRFRDRDGASVAIGDGRRAGYVALILDADETWLSGSRPPRASARAARADGLPLDPIVLEDTGSRAGRVERWREAGWEGSWLVFRLAYKGGRGIEIGLPVEGAWRSLALFWVPATFRPEGLPPAPPPIDAAERLGIRFERLRGGERARSPLTEGWLSAPGLRVELPRGWYPVASIRAADGFPITVFDRSGALTGTLSRHSAEKAAAMAAGAGAGDAGGAWLPVERPSIHRAAAVYAKADGSRLFIAREGHGFLFEPSGPGGEGAREGWDRLAGSAALSKPKTTP